MHLIVPLAGPDFIGNDGALKALRPFKGRPILKYILDSRPWIHDLDAITFILIDNVVTRQFASDYLSKWFPGSLSVFLSTYSRGAAFSSLAGIACQSNFTVPIIVDLADIFYKTSIKPNDFFRASQVCGGIGLVFSSNDPLYSYLRCDSSGKFCEAAEKKVISHSASVGTYFFKNSAVFLRALAHAIDNESSQTHNNLFYLCPLFNGVLCQGLDIAIEEVDQVVDVKVIAPKAF